MTSGSGSSRSLQTLNTFFKSEPSYAHYGSGKYQQARNIVSLLTNAVRVELRDVLLLLRAIAERPHLLTLEHVDQVYDWLEESVNYMNVSLNVLHDEVMEMTAKKVNDMGALSARGRMLAMGRVQRSFLNLLDTQEMFQQNAPPGERFEKMCDAAGELRECLELLSVIDGVLPGLLREGFGKGDLKRFEKRLFHFLADRVGGRDAVDGVMTRWMTKRQTQYMKRRRGLVVLGGKVDRARSGCGKEHTTLVTGIAKMLDEEEMLQVEMQDVMNPEVQRKLNSAARERLARKFSGLVPAKDFSDEGESFCASEDEQEFCAA